MPPESSIFAYRRAYFRAPCRCIETARLAISGTTAIVGAPGDDANGRGCGAAYMFDTASGQQLAVIVSNDGAWGDNLGFRSGVGISGSTVIVGAYGDEDNGSYSGAAYLFDVSTLICPVDFEYPNGRPMLVNSNGGVTMRVVTVNGGGEPQPGTGVLHVDRGNGFEAFPMSAISDNVYDAIFPSSNCGSVLRYYVSAENIDGEQFTDPPDASSSSYSVISSLDAGTVVFAGNFETDLGWTVTGDATDGHWDRGVPVGDGSRGDPLTDADGSGSCYLTDNAAGNSDVDNGSTVLTSPILDATGPNPILSFYRWHSGAEDVFAVKISNDSGASWTNLETLHPHGSEVYGGWFWQSFRIADFVQPTDQMRVRFIASDNDPQRIVESGVDGVEIRLIDCGGSNVVIPDALTVTRGLHVAGDAASLSESDNVDLALQRLVTDVQSRTEFEVIGTSPTISPTSLAVTLEGAVFARSTVVQTIELYDYVAGAWELVDTRNATNMTDSTATVVPTGELSRFVDQATLEVKARVHFQSLSPRQRFASNTDQFMWTIGQ